MRTFLPIWSKQTSKFHLIDYGNPFEIAASKDVCRISVNEWFCVSGVHTNRPQMFPRRLTCFLSQHFQQDILENIPLKRDNRFTVN